MTPAGQIAIQASGVAQVLTTCIAFFGDQIFAMLDMHRTPLARYVLENKLQLLGFSFLLNSIAQSLAKTDAFEVFINGELVFSKLAKKRMPTIDEVLAALADHGVSMGSHGGLSRPSHSRQS